MRSIRWPFRHTFIHIPHEIFFSRSSFQLLLAELRSEKFPPRYIHTYTHTYMYVLDPDGQHSEQASELQRSAQQSFKEVAELNARSTIQISNPKILVLARSQECDGAARATADRIVGQRQLAVEYLLHISQGFARSLARSLARTRTVCVAAHCIIHRSSNP